jgi:Flp pilus assembly protein TadB
LRRVLDPLPEESFVSGSEILLVAVAILVPLAIAIAVTLWTLQPAVLRNERAKRARKRFAQSSPTPPQATAEDASSPPE